MAFLLPVIIAAAKVVGTGALAAGKAAGTAALAGAKALGTGALAGAKALGTGAVTAGKALGSGAMSVGKGITQAANKMLNMGGGGGAGSISPSTQVANVMGQPVTFGQTAQGAGMNMTPGGVMQGGAATGNNMMSKIQDMAKSMLQSKSDNKKEQAPAPPGLVGGSPMPSFEMPQFGNRQNIGMLIAQMLRAQRGF